MSNGGTWGIFVHMAMTIPVIEAAGWQFGCETAIPHILRT